LKRQALAQTLSEAGFEHFINNVSALDADAIHALWAEFKDDSKLVHAQPAVAVELTFQISDSPKPCLLALLGNRRQAGM